MSVQNPNQSRSNPSSGGGDYLDTLGSADKESIPILPKYNTRTQRDANPRPGIREHRKNPDKRQDNRPGHDYDAWDDDGWDGNRGFDNDQCWSGPGDPDKDKWGDGKGNDSRSTGKVMPKKAIVVLP